MKNDVMLEIKRKSFGARNFCLIAYFSIIFIYSQLYCHIQICRVCYMIVFICVSNNKNLESTLLQSLEKQFAVGMKYITAVKPQLHDFWCNFSCKRNRVSKASLTLKQSFAQLKGWFPLGVNCRRSVKNFLFLYLVLYARARIKNAHAEPQQNTQTAQPHLASV